MYKHTFHRLSLLIHIVCIFHTLEVFFKSANFERWFRNRQNEIQQKLQLLHYEALSVAVRILTRLEANEDIDSSEVIRSNPVAKPLIRLQFRYSLNVGKPLT